MEKSGKTAEKDTNIQEQLERYIIHWKWFVITMLFSLVLGFLYLRYSTPQYKASTTIVIKDDKKGGAVSELATFSDKGILGTGKNNIDNEIEVLRSRTIVEKQFLTCNLM